MAASGGAKHEPDVVVYLHRGPIDQAVIGLAEERQDLTRV